MGDGGGGDGAAARCGAWGCCCCIGGGIDDGGGGGGIDDGGGIDGFGGGGIGPEIGGALFLENGRYDLMMSGMCSESLNINNKNITATATLVDMPPPAIPNPSSTLMTVACVVC